MNTTSQTTKIGQLPRNIRHQLGCRIQAGQSDADLVEWLNAQDAVKEHFGEETLTEENLAEWRDNGHPEWLRQQQTAEKARRLAEHAQDPARHRAPLHRFYTSTVQPFNPRHWAKINPNKG